MGASILSLVLALTPATASQATEGERAAAALRALRQVLADLPPGAERDELAKAVTKVQKRFVADAESRIKVAESDVEMRSERVAWAERMVKKGYLSRAQLDADRTRLGAASAELGRLRGELRRLKQG